MTSDVGMESESAGPGGEGEVRAGGPAPARVRRSSFWIAVLLGVWLVACKAQYFGGPEGWSWGPVWRYVADLGITAHADVWLALVVGLGGAGLLWACRRWPRVEGAAWYGLALVGAACVFYGVVSVRIFQYLRMPLTYPMLYMAGDPGNMSSSLARYATGGYVLALVGLPVVYGALVMLLRRWPPRTTRTVRAMQAAGIVLLAAWVGWGRAEAQGRWGGQPRHWHLADNPHYELAASVVSQIVGVGAPGLGEAYSAEEVKDFEPVSVRGAGSVPTAGLKRGPKNVVLVVCESVGAQQWSLYGGQYGATPRLEAESAHSLLFDNFYCHVPNTANALFAIALSQYAPLSWREGTTEHPDWAGTTLAQLLKGRGYRTAFISAGDNEWSSQGKFLKGRGFDEVWDWRQSGVQPHMSWGVRDSALVDMVLKFVDGEEGSGFGVQSSGKSGGTGPKPPTTSPAADRPFFVVAWTQGTHHPYEPYPGQEEIDFLKGKDPPDAWDLNRYLNVLYEMDRQVGRLLDELRRRGLDRDTLVVITGDHGEAFGWPHPVWGHTHSGYQESVRVPLMVWSPSLFERGERSRAIGAQVDLSPTIADLLGLELPESWQGRSLFDPAGGRRAYFYGAMDRYLFGVREGKWKYVYDATNGREELYNLEADPLEERNVAAENAEVAQRLRRRLAAWVGYQNQKDAAAGSRK